MKKKTRLKAFSLVELLIALSIFAVVSIAIYSTFNSGLKVLRKVKDVDLAQQSFIFKVERLSREIRETIPLRKLSLSGSKEKLAFGLAVGNRPCRLTYYFDNSNKNLMRGVDNLADIISNDTETKETKINPELKSKGAVFLKGIKEVRFGYLYLDLKTKAYAWAEEWEEDFLPLAIRFNLSTDKQDYETIIFLPTA